ncbi:hypothetical protein DSO57_1017045 [Entomophthora muscae]|uniref:Uncharacterized protein n=1 Tax=Entomophthora muscae TaxID=34485 RepID=A0ACC2SHE2_9FUNG|nr:hypothetical protein DSO57_1017045 [Entomophthora muscae]
MVQRIVNPYLASKKVQADSHNVSIFPAGHTDLHLGDVLFFNIGDTICGCNLTTFRQVVGAANNNTDLFSCQKFTKLFIKMALNSLSSSQSSKDPQIPPCDSPAYKTITVLVREGG